MVKHPIIRDLRIKKLAKFSSGVLFWVKRHKWWAAVIIVIILTLAIILRPKASKPISTEPVKRQEFVQTISITGTIEAIKSVDLTFPIGGTIAYVGVQKSDFVEQYQTIATLDARTTLKNLQNALLSYSLQRNAFDQTQENNQNRTPNQALNDSMRRILEDNQYNLDKAITSVELQDLARQQSILVSPIAGIVTRADAKTFGSTATPATIFQIVDPNSLTFKMDVDEADIAKVKNGQSVKVLLNAYPDKTISLHIDSIDFATHVTSTGGNAYSVYAHIPSNKNYIYRIGMNGNAEIIISEHKNALTIPLSSIVDDNKIYIKTKNGFEKKSVKIGLQNDTAAEVLGGLTPGALVVTDPTLLPTKK